MTMQISPGSAAQPAAEPPGPSRTRRPSPGALISAALVAGLLAGGAAGGTVGVALQPSTAPTATPGSQNSTVLSVAGSQAQDLSGVVASVADAVVTIEVSGAGPRGTQATGSGSGFIVRSDGLILTSYHVIDGASTITVLTTDGTSYAARVVAEDASRDVAVLDVDATSLPTITLSTAEVEVGQEVISIGTALGEYPNTVTTGVISGLDRQMTASTGLRTSETLTDVIQTDAALNSGMSGGPLLDAAGRAIGINTAVYGDANGIGFAVPISDAVALLGSIPNS